MSSRALFWVKCTYYHQAMAIFLTNLSGAPLFTPKAALASAEVHNFLFCMFYFLFSVVKGYYTIIVSDKYNPAGIMTPLGEDHFWRIHVLRKHTNKCSWTDGRWSQIPKGWTQQVVKIDTYLQSSNLGSENSRLPQIFGIFIEALKEFHSPPNYYTYLWLHRASLQWVFPWFI